MDGDIGSNVGDDGRRQFPKTPKNDWQSISGRSGPEGHGCGQRRGRLKMSPPSTSEDIFILSSHHSVRMQPYALHAPLLGVGVFSAFSLLREPHTVHTAAYGSHWNPALALLPVGIEASSARRKPKVHTDPHTDFADFRRNRPPMKSIRLRPSLIPFDA